jgi:two-component system, NtrC family, sensor histidine kinase HydH
MNRNTKARAILIVAIVVLITFLHYHTELSKHKHHILYQGLFFVPVMLSGFWFGLRGALVTSLSTTLLLIPFGIIHWEHFSSDDFNNIVEMVLYNFVGAILGVLRDRDLVKQKRLRETESLAAIGRTVSCLAHDMKTPLVAIGGFARLVQKKIEQNHPSYEKLGIVLKETERLENMVKDMLDFSRPLELHLSEEGIDLVIYESLNIVGSLAEKKRVRLESRCPEGSLRAVFDSVRMKQVLINLAVNAVQASPEGEMVAVCAYRRARKLIIDVSDRGCGIPLDNREQVFTDFFTTKSDGTGLGLPIAKRIVEAHGGWLEIIDNPDRGLTFRVTLPLTPKEVVS